MESTVPLDAHGNPVTTDDDNDGEVDRDGGYLELDQRTRRSSSGRRRVSLSDGEHVRIFEAVLAYLSKFLLIHLHAHSCDSFPPGR
jgi:hypothetical protein